MSSAFAAGHIAAALRETLARGLDLSNETLRYIDSTFSHPSTAELAALVQDDRSTERDSLLELLFWPDEALQVELESLLASAHAGRADAEAVVAQLARTPLTVRFRFPDGRANLEVEMTTARARRLVLGLRIDRQIPASVAGVIEAAVPVPGRQGLRVMIRSARFDFTPACRQFLCALIPKIDAQNEDGRQCFAFALELLDELGASDNVFTGLAARKNWLAKALNLARRQREHLDRANVETLLSQGQRLTCVDEALARRQMAYIDCIGMAVFGRRVPVDADGWEQAVEIDGAANVADLLQRLT